MNQFTITPSYAAGSHKTGTWSSTLTVDEISEILGFEPNIEDDPDKVEFSWGADVYDEDTGEESIIAIWDYHGVRWSTYGDRDVLDKLLSQSVGRMAKDFVHPPVVHTGGAKVELSGSKFNKELDWSE